VVKTTRGGCGSIANWVANETPSFPGKLMSRKTASGRNSAQSRNAASVSVAVPTTSTCEVSSSSVARYSAAKGSSSTITVRIRTTWNWFSLNGFRSHSFQHDGQDQSGAEPLHKSSGCDPGEGYRQVCLNTLS
jgi:hypothetical protein